MEVIIHRKNVKYLRLTVNTDGQAVLSCPYGVSDEKIEEFLKKNEKWLQKTVKRVYDDTDKYSISEGSIIYILGKPYSMRFITSDENKCYLDGGCINIVTKSFDLTLINRTLEKYLDSLRLKVYKESLDKYLNITGEHISSLEIKKMKRAYGKCFYKERRIVLNKSLIHRTIEFIDSVVLHEIAHLKYPNHQKEFYNYIYSFMPDYEINQKKLKY